MPTELQFNFTQTKVDAEISKARSWRGVSAEFVRMDSGSEYEFEWNGGSHYVALHDLILRDGEMTVDGMASIPGGDLRGKLSYVPPDRQLKGWARSEERTNTFVVVCFDPDTLSQETETLYRNSDFKPQIYFHDLQLQQTLMKLQSILAAGNRYDNLYAETLGLITALEIYHLQGQPPALAMVSRGGLSQNQMKLVDEFIRDEMNAELSLDMLAGLTGLSRFHFSRAFKVSFGVPPHQYVKLRRVEKAKSLLSTTASDVQTVAIAVGLKSSVRMIRAFQEILGTTPGKFRRNV